MKKILLIRLSSLGDVIFNIPLANALKDGGYELTWLTSEKGADVVKNNPCVDKVIVAPIFKWKKSKLSDFFKNFIEYLGLLRQIRKGKYDIAIDTQRMFKSLCWTAFCGAKRRLICADAKELSRLGANEVIPAIETSFERHSVDNYLQFAKYLGLNTEHARFTLPESTAETKAKVDSLLEGVKTPFTVIAPATTWKLKHWNPDNWKELVNSLKDRYSLVFTGMERDKELISCIGGDEHVNLAGKTGVSDLIEIFSRAALVITPDSGSCHLARATGKPSVIAIFTCTPPGLFGPQGEGHFSLSGNLPCQPCLTKKCPLKTKNLGRGSAPCVDYPKPCDIMNIIETKIGV